MRSFYLGPLVVGALLSVFATIAVALDAKDEAIKKDRKQMEGTWRVLDLKINGNQGGDEAVRKITVVIGPDGAWSLRSEDKEFGKGTSTIDPTNSSKTIDLTPTEGDDNGNPSPGIYEINDNTLKVCIGPSGKYRSTEFISTPGYLHNPPAGRVDQATLDSLDLEVGNRFGYWFDFGDDWWHQINVESIEDKVPIGKFPKVTKRVGKDPPQYAEEE